MKLTVKNIRSSDLFRAAELAANSLPCAGSLKETMEQDNTKGEATARCIMGCVYDAMNQTRKRGFSKIAESFYKEEIVEDYDYDKDEVTETVELSECIDEAEVGQLLAERAQKGGYRGESDLVYANDALTQDAGGNILNAEDSKQIDFSDPKVIKAAEKLRKFQVKTLTQLAKAVAKVEAKEARA
jgi:hypothetical protein